MSICIISMTPERALVAVDTACTTYGHPYSGDECAKLFLLPHAGCVLVGRGSVALTRRVFSLMLNHHAESTDFDDLAERMPGWLASSYGALCDREGDLSAAFLAEGNEAYLVGWSNGGACMQAQAFIQRAGGDPFKAGGISHWHAAPWDFATMTDAPTSIDELDEMANKAVNFGQSICSDLGFGGRLVIADVRRDGISTVVRSLAKALGCG